MASPVPAKSQPLHNFSLPHLKWKNHRTGRNRLAGEPSSSSSSPPPYVSRRPSPLQKRESESESESKPNSAVVQIQKPKTITEKSIKSIDNKGKRSNKICIRFRKNDAVPDQNESVTPEHEEDESSPKIWNLRPRRPPVNHKQFNGSLPKIGSSPLPENKTSNNRESSELKINPMTSKKTKFSIALTRDEIEEDVFSITGLKPSRRPKKRPKSVQRQLDTLFPGLWLGSITVDTYKVSEAPLKG